MTSSGNEVNDSQSEADATEDDTEIPPLKVPFERFQELLQTTTETTTKIPEGDRPRKKGRVNRYEESQRICERIWKTDPSSEKASDRALPGHMFPDTYQKHVAALALRKEQSVAGDAPFDAKRDAAASYNPAGYSDSTIDKTLESIMSSTKNTKPGTVPVPVTLRTTIEGGIPGEATRHHQPKSGRASTGLSTRISGHR